MISPFLPYDGIDHGGGRYLEALHRVLADRADVVFIVPTHRAGDRQRPGSPQRVLLRGEGGRGALALRVLNRVWGLLRIVDANTPDLALLVDIIMDPTTRTLVAGADVVDLHFQDFARMARFLRPLNRRAEFVLTLYDVTSQRFERIAASSSKVPRIVRYRLMAALARSAEKRAVRSRGTVVVFSQKDADLMDTAASIRVIDLPRAVGDVLPHGPTPGLRTVVFVGALARPENDDAIRWCIDQVWPSVVERLPDARLKVIGRGASQPLIDLVEGRSDVVLEGYVDDLALEYSRAWVCVVPLRLGAGVKVKTIEAMVAGLPVVTTSIGAEGIEGPHLFAGLSDNPSVLAQRLTWVLENPEQAYVEARRTQEWALERYGRARFEQAVAEIYLSS